MASTGGGNGSESALTIIDFLKAKAKPSRKERCVPTSLQLQLALLWRTLRVLRYNDDMPAIIRSFFDDLLLKVKSLPSLSLSTSWNSFVKNGNESSSSSAGCKVNSGKVSGDGSSYIGIPNNTSSGVVQLNALHATELNYLHGNQDCGDDDLVHDPLGAVYKILESAEGFAMSVPSQEQGASLSLCLALSVKSGRLSLLLHTISCLIFSEGHYCDIDVLLLQDITDYMQKLTSASSQGSSGVDGSTSTSTRGPGPNMFYSKSRRYLDMYAPTTTRMKQLLVNAPRADGDGSSSSSVRGGGVVVSFGKADQGKLGHGDNQINRLIPTLIEQLGDIAVVKVASMSTNVMAIDKSGSLYLWGSGGSVVMSHGARIDLVPTRFNLLPNCRVTDISCGLAHALFLTCEHKVYSRGNGGNGRLGLGDTSDRIEPQLVASLQWERIASIQCGACHSLALSDSGALYSWGKNTQGQCGLGTADDVLTPAANKTLQGLGVVVRGVAAGWEHSLCVTVDGRVYSWGCGYKDSRRGIVPPVLGLGNNEGKQCPECITSIEGIHIVSITCGWDHCLALDSSGRLLSWGSGQNGKLGHGNEENMSAPCYVVSLESVKVVKIGAGSEHSAAISDRGLIYTWGHGDGGRLGHGDNSQCLLPSPIVCVTMMNSTPLEVHCGDKFTMLVVSCDSNIIADSKASRLGVLSSSSRLGSISRQLPSPADEKAMVEHLDKESIFCEDAVFRQMERLGSSSGVQPLLNNFLQSHQPQQHTRDAPRLESGGVTRQQLGYYALSLLARSCGSAADEEGDMRPFAIECTSKTYANLSRLVERHSEPFSECVGKLGCVGTGYLEEPNLEDSVESITSDFFTAASSPSHKGPRNASTTNFDAGSAWAKSLSADIMASYLPLHCLLTVLTVNLEALVRQHERSRKVSFVQDDAGVTEASPSHLQSGQGGESAEQKDASTRADPSNDSIGEYDQRFDFTHSEGDSDDNSSSGNEGSGAVDDELEADDGDNLAERYDKSEADVRDDTSVYNESPDRLTRDMEQSGQRPGGAGRHRMSASTSEPLQQQAAPVFDFRGESIGERVRSRGSSQPGSRRNSRTGLPDGGVGRPPLSLHIDQNNALEDSMDNSMDESLLNSPRNGYEYNGPMSPGALSVSGDFEQHNFKEYDDSNNQGSNNNDLYNGSNKSTPARAGDGTPPNMLDQLEESDDGYGALTQSFDNTEASLGIAGMSAGRFRDRGGSFEASDSELEMSTENIDTSGYAAAEDSVDVQRAILSSMETQKEENAILQQALSELHDPRQVMARLKDTLVDLALTSYGAMTCEGGRRQSPSADDSAALSAAASIWLRCQSALAQGFPVFYSDGDKRRIARELLVSPENLLYIIPAMCNGFLSCPDEHPPSDRFRDSISSSDAARGPEQGCVEDLLRSISFIEGTLLVARLSSSPSSHKLKFNDSMCRSYYIFFRAALESLLAKVLGAAVDGGAGRTTSFVMELLGRVTDCLCSDIETSFSEGSNLYCTEQAADVWIANSFSGLLLPCVVSMLRQHPRSPLNAFYIPKSIQVLRAMERRNVLSGVQYADQPLLPEKGSQRLGDWLSESLKMMLTTVVDGIFLLRQRPSPGYNIDSEGALSEFAELISAPDAVGGMARAPLPFRLGLEERLRVAFDTYRNMRSVLPLAASETPTDLPPAESVRSLYSSEAKTVTALAHTMEAFARGFISQHMPFLRDEKIWEKFGFSTVTVHAVVDIFTDSKVLTERNEVLATLIVLFLQSLSKGVDNFTDGTGSIAGSVKERLPSIWMNSFTILVCLIEMRETKRANALAHFGSGKVEPLHDFILKKATFLIEFLPSRNFPLLFEFWGDKSNMTIDYTVTQISELLRICAKNRFKPYRFEIFVSNRREVSTDDELSAAYAHSKLISLLAGDISLDDLQQLVLHNEYIRRSAVVIVGAISSVMQITKQSQLLQHFFVDLFFNVRNSDNALSCDTSFAALSMEPIKVSANSRKHTGVFQTKCSQEVRSVVLFLDETLSGLIDMIDLTTQSHSDLYKAFANLPCLLSCLHFCLNYIYNFYVLGDAGGEKGLTASTFLGLKAMSKALEKVLAVLSHCDSSSSIADKAGFAALHSSFVRSVDMCFQQYIMLLTESYIKSPHSDNNIVATSALPSSSSQPSVVSMLSQFMRCGSVLSKELVQSIAQFQDFIVRCRAWGATFILAGIKPVASTSPSIVSNVFTPHGDYTIGFWMKLSPGLLSYGNKIHILSRTLETGDFNFVSLVSCRSPSQPNPSICLSFEDGVAYLIVSLSVTEVSVEGTEGAGKEAKKTVRTTKKLQIKSGKLPLSEWVRCVLHVRSRTESVVTKTPTKGNIKASLNTGVDIVTRLEKTAATLYINGCAVAEAEVAGGRTHLHQNVIIGTIPWTLAAREDEQLVVSDVFWCSKQLPAPTEPATAHPFNAFFMQEPPSVLFAKIDYTAVASARLLDVVSVCLHWLGVGAATAREAQALSRAMTTTFPQLCELVMCVCSCGDEVAQASALAAMKLATSFVPKIALSALSSTADEAPQKPSIAAPMTPTRGASAVPASPVVGSALNAAHASKAMAAVRSTFFDLVDLLGVVMSPTDVLCTLLSSLVPVGAGDDSKLLWQIWIRRILFNRDGAERKLKAPEWALRSSMNENLLSTSIACFAEDCLLNGVIDSNFFNAPASTKPADGEQLACCVQRWLRPKREFSADGSATPQFVSCDSLAWLALTCLGGCPTVAAVHRCVQVPAGSVFAFPPASGSALFPSSGAVLGSLLSHRPSIVARNCVGAFVFEGLRYDASAVPAGMERGTPITELTVALNPMKLLPARYFAGVLQSWKVATVTNLTASLCKIVASTAELKSGMKSIYDPLHAPALLKESTSADARSLMLTMAYLRSVLVQLTAAKGLVDEARVEHGCALRDAIAANLPNIFLLASTNPSDVVSSAFDGGNFKGAQLDILKNLLKEGDIGFLEKISLRSWRQLRHSMHSFEAAAVALQERMPAGGETSLLNPSGEPKQPLAPDIHLSALEGDVQLMENRLKALSHFPTVRLQGVSMERMTGRWYYECTLLSDGLMQIGWATNLFRCDPVCGQGVGDHLYSWAFDGLRTKKWNVSCETYGRRWRAGDVVGALIDMDLLEMRFSLNGSDLGQAFGNFATSSSMEIFPALSLNVRQSLRVNFGQHKFLHPPDEVDGKPFRPVCLAGRHGPKPKIAAPKKAQSPGKSSPFTDIYAQINNVSWKHSSADTDGADALADMEPQPGTGDGPGMSSSQLAPVDSALSPSDADIGDSAVRDVDFPRGEDSEEGGGGYDEAEDEAAILMAMESEWREQTDTRQEEEDDSGDRDANPHIMQLRRQSLIENLIGMGFPVDWSLRAAEHCDASVSESAAIAWIIERMEFEQTKMDELEGESSRMAEEEAEEGGLQYLMQKRPSAHAAGASSEELLALMGNGSGGFEQGSDAYGSAADAGGAHPLTSSQTSEELAADSYGGINIAEIYRENFEGNIPWNPDVSFAPILAPHGREARARGDMDRQEVLLQVTELDPLDMIPIVASCELSLCVFYARAVVAKLMEMGKQRLPPQAAEEYPTSTAASKLSGSVLSLLLRDSDNASIKHFLSHSFKHCMSANSQPERFLQLTPATASSDAARVPSIEPFMPPGLLEEHLRCLAELEMLLLTDSSVSTAAEEASVQTLGAASSFLSALLLHSALQLDDGGDHPSPAGSNINSDLTEMETKLLKGVGIHINSVHSSELRFASQRSSEILGHLVEECVSALEAAATPKNENFDWILCPPKGDDDLLSKSRGAQGDSARSSVLWAYHSLRGLITTAVPKAVYINGVRLATANSIIPHVTSDALSRLLRLSFFPSASLRFIVFDLCSLLLSRVHTYLSNDFNGDDVGPDARQLQLAAEYYVSIAKEKMILHMFGARMRAEGLTRHLFSLYTRALGNFLLQWQLLRRALGLFSYPHVREYISQQWLQGSADSDEPSGTLVVTQVSCSSVVVAWNISPAARGAPACLYISVASSMGLDNPLLVLANATTSGSQRIDDLTPDTLYKITVSFDSLGAASSLAPPPPQAAPRDFSAYAATDAEVLFVLDALSMSPNLVLGSSHLVVRHKANKKWSTCRASAKLVSGVHRWDVHVDRCVSKNIFIGVTTADARLDNYVGCDKYGWAFLANKAVWHNKGKLKAYGELFRTGDAVTVTLDLDNGGTLSFSLNGRDLGVAVEGLVGPLYPSFSLYNEDDQLSIVPASPHRARDEQGTPSAAAAERVLDRMDALQSLLVYYTASYSQQRKDLRQREEEEGEQRRDTRPYGGKQLCVPLSLAEELKRRWVLWEQDVSIRSTLHNNDFISIVMSPSACEDMSAMRLSVKDVVSLDEQRARVLGVSSNRLWLQSEATGELCGFTRDSLQQLASKGSLQEQERHPPSGRPSAEVLAQLGHQPPAYASAAEMASALTLQRPRWTRAEDELLVSWLDTLARAQRTHPINLPLHSIVSARGPAVKFFESMPKALVSHSDFGRLYSAHSDLDICLRASALMHLNDILLPLLPLCCPEGRQRACNHPSRLLLPLRGHVFEAVKDEFAHKMAMAQGEDAGPPEAEAEATATAPLAGAEAAPTATNTSVSSASAGSPAGAFVLQIEEESAALNRILRSTYDCGPMSLHERQRLCQDTRWQVASRIRSSLLGQLFVRLHSLAESSPAPSSEPRGKVGVAATATSAVSAGGSASSTAPAVAPLDRACEWDAGLAFLRGTFSRSLMFGAGPAAGDIAGSVPFTLRRRPSSSMDAVAVGGDATDEPSNLFKIMSLQSRSEGVVSDWVVLIEFMKAALAQVACIISLLPGEDSGRVWSTGEASLILQFLHAAGVLAGLCARCGARCEMGLSTRFLDLLVGGASELLYEALEEVESLPAPQRAGRLLLLSAAAVFRRGLCSIFPEAALDLLSASDISLLLGGPAAPSSVDLLERCCTYDAQPMPAQTARMQMFWMCLRHFPASKLTRMLQHLWTLDDFPEFIYSMRFHELPQRLLLRAGGEEVEEVIFETDSRCIIVPQCDSAGAMMAKVERALNRLL